MKGMVALVGLYMFLTNGLKFVFTFSLWLIDFIGSILKGKR